MFFFDVQVRKAEPKDPLDEEWAKFQKEMQVAATVRFLNCLI